MHANNGYHPEFDTKEIWPFLCGPKIIKKSVDKTIWKESKIRPLLDKKEYKKKNSNGTEIKQKSPNRKGTKKVQKENRKKSMTEKKIIPKTTM